MNNHVTREDAEKLIVCLGGDPRAFHDIDHEDQMDPLDYSEQEVRIGDVLEKMQGATTSFAKVNYEHDVEKLCSHWMPCGFSNSLQEILEESWELVDNFCSNTQNNTCVYCKDDHRRLSPDANALFRALISLFPEK